MWVWIEFDSVFVSPLGASLCRVEEMVGGCLGVD